MTVKRLSTRFCRPAAILLCLPLALAGYAQDESDAESDSDNDTLEEIIVVAPKPGSRRSVDPEYVDPVRARVLKDLYDLRRDEAEVEALDAASERPIVSTPRVQLGYDPTEDYLRRNEMDLQNPQRETTRPATIFRVSF